MGKTKILTTLMGSTPYYKRMLNIFGSSVVGYWTMNESSGTVAYDKSSNAHNGVYTGVDLANTAAPIRGMRAPLFGTGDLLNIYSASLNTAFDGQEGTMIAWCKVSEAAIWTNGTVGVIFSTYADNNNRIYLRRSTTNNRIEFGYMAGGTNSGVSTAVTATTDWFQLALTWSKANDRLIRYQNAVKLGDTIATLGTFAGDLDASATIIGANWINATLPWFGWLSNIILLNREATASEVQLSYPF